MFAESLNNITSFPLESIIKLTKCNREIFSNMDLEKVYEAIVDGSFCMLKNTKICLLYAYNSENHILELIKEEGIERHYIKSTIIKGDDGIIGEVAATGAKKVVNNFQQNQLPIAKEIILKKQIEKMICLPLKIKSSVIAVLNLFLSASENLIPHEELLIEILSGHAAVAIQQANVYQNMKHTIEDMNSVVQSARGITSTLDLNCVLENILAASQQIANTHIAFFWYKDFISNEWKREFPKNLKGEGLNLPNIAAGEGLIGHVLQTAQPYLCSDVTTDEHYFPTWKETKSELVIPLIIENEVKGFLDVESTTCNAFSERHLQLLTMLAAEAAIALRNAQLYQIAERKTQQFITLKEISEALSQRKSLPEILTIIARESLSIVGHGKKVGAVMLIDRGKNMLETKGFYGDRMCEQYRNFHIPLPQTSIATWVARDGKPRLAVDVSTDTEYLKIIKEVKSEICIPLFFRDEVIGVIDIESSEVNAFDEQDIELLQTLADNTAIATKIGELYDVRLRQLEALYKTGTKINSSLKLNDVLNSIAHEGLQAIGADNRTFYVQLINNENGLLEIKVAAGNNSHIIQYIGHTLEKDTGISGQVIKNRTYYLCPNVEQDIFYKKLHSDVKSELCVPIIFSDQVIGLINIESVVENDFGQYEIQLLQQLANQAGMAIENARLSEELADTQFQLSETLGITVVGETLASLIHDIRTSSSLISGEAQWIEYQHENNNLNIESVLEAMQKIESHVARIESITTDLMQRSKQTIPIMNLTRILDIARSAIHLTSGFAHRQQVDFIVDFPSLHTKRYAECHLEPVHDNQKRRIWSGSTAL